MKKIMVGMSGGVDSSVAAMLLKKQGFDVTGVTMRLFSDEDIVISENGRKSCALSDTDDAKSVAERLGFGHIVFSFGEEFRSFVMDKFVRSYLSGKTPNPCVDCNRYCKFGKMLEKAEELGYDGIATGHYAVIEFDERSGRYLLKRPKDSCKDQTYVLYSLTQRQLAHTFFPLGELEKSEVRRIAEESGLVNSKKPDSQDICFVPNGKYDEFIRKFTGTEPPYGDFTDLEGRILGVHKGIDRYTIGQRKGLGISLGKPAYVVSKDAAANTVVLGNEEDLYTSSLKAEDVNLIAFESLEAPMRITAKTRYGQKDQPATLSYDGGGIYRVDFDKPQRAVTAGQAVVFYDGDVVIGGGTII